MATFNSKLVKKEIIAKGTMAFFFEKPEGFTYTAGQHITLFIKNPIQTDQERDQRIFTFTSAPFEDQISFATRMRDSAFKRNLADAAIGLEVGIIDPRGSMVLPQNSKRPLIFLAGGIGITPFMSMIKQATHKNLHQKITLFYSNRKIEDAPFLEELQKLSSQNSNLTFVPAFTDEDFQESKWNGEKGRISKEMLKKYLPDLKNCVFYVAGPLGLVEGITKVLTEADIDPLFIKSEDFGEYK